MKKFLTWLTVLAVLLSLCATAVAAEPEQSLDAVFEEATGILDIYYELNGYYMATKVAQTLYTWEEMEQNNYEPKVVSAAEVEEMLYAFFAPTEDQLQSFRVELQYDAAAGTYTLSPWGGSGGFLPERQYLGYQVLGDTYKVYWQTVEYAFLSTVLPDDVDEYEYAGSLGWPETITYGGLEYENGPEGYYCIRGMLPDGNAYTVEYNGEVVRILSVETFAEDTFPVIHKIPADSGMTLETGDSFEAGTVVTVETELPEEITQTLETAVAGVARQYYAFDITAQRDGQSVQPGAPVQVTLSIPEAFSTDVSVFYLNETNGQLEELETQVDAATRTVTVALEHFSIYLMADNATKPAPGEPTQPTQPTEPGQTTPQATTGAQTGTQPQPGTNGNDDAGNSGDIGIWIAVAAIAAAVVLLVVGLLLYRKNGRK